MMTMIPITSGQSKSTNGCIVTAYGRFNRIRQYALLSNACFLGPSAVHKPHSISIDSAVFAGLTIVTDRQTEPCYSVSNNRPYLRA